MSDSTASIAYLTAGAGGMFCGSCLHDNTLARALQRIGVDVQLVPTYTPIRTDEENVSVDRVFLGGINVYLQQTVPLFRYLPAIVDRWLAQPWLLEWATSKAMQTSPRQLGALAVSMLKGTQGHQRKEVLRLCQWLAEQVRPRMVVLSNMLIGGCVPALKERLGVPVLVTLQGDDIFLGGLMEPYQTQAIEEIRRLSPHVDGFLVHSRYYAEFMCGYLGLPDSQVHLVPLGLDVADFRSFLADGAPRSTAGHATASGSDRTPIRPPTIGYLARLAKEKGLHLLVDAFARLRKMPGTEDARLLIAGWLGANDRAYAEAEFAKLREGGLGSAFEYLGAVDRQGKLDFLRRIDLLSVPTTYREPKGIFVLEALAAGVPVVEPDHGAFPEMLGALGGGRLVRPNDAQHLAETMHQLLVWPAERLELGRVGQKSVHDRFSSEAMARATWETWQKFLPSRTRE